jgi:predicted small lipoprotein YifL
MSRVFSAVAATVLVLGLAACGEKPAVTVYKQGQYQGKPDGRPWENDQFKGDQAAWEKSLKARNVNQNEYVRIGG